MAAVTLQRNTIKINIVTPKRVIKLDKVGIRGPSGLSAYLQWVRQPGNEGKTEAEFFAWIANAQIDAILPYLTQAAQARNEAQAAAVSAEAAAVVAAGSENAAEQSADAAVFAQQNAVAARDTAIAEATAAQASAIAAGEAADAAIAARILAEAAIASSAQSAIDAEASKVAADVARIAAEQKASEAEVARVAAVVAKDAAEAAQADVSASALAAETARLDAVAAKEAAELAASNSGDYSDAAIAARDAAAASEAAAIQKALDAEASRVAAEAAVISAAVSADAAALAQTAAEAAQGQAEAAAVVALAQAEAADTARIAAQAAQAVAEGVQAAIQILRDQALQYRNEALQFRNEAGEIAGGDFLSRALADTLYRAIDALITVGDVTGLQEALDGKTTAAAVQAAGDLRYRQLAVALGIADIEGLTAALGGKATPADIAAAVQAIVGMAPAELDTLKEIADRLVGAEDDYAALVLVLAGKASQNDLDALALLVADKAAQADLVAAVARVTALENKPDSVLTVNGTGPDEAGNIEVTAGATPWLIKTANYNAVDGDRILADTSAGAWTLTLPAYGEVFIQDVLGTWEDNNLTVAGPIRGVTGNLICDQAVTLQLVRLDGAAAWTITKSAGVGDAAAAILSFATVAEIWAASTFDKVVAPVTLNNAMLPITLNITAGSVAPDCHNGINFDIPTINANITIANLANKAGKLGRSGSITGKNDATAGRTVSLGTDWKKIGTTAFPTTANAMWKMVYNVDSNGVNYSVMVLSA